MRTEDEGKKLSTTALISRSFKIVMVVLYIGLGTTIIFKADDIYRNIPVLQNTSPSYIQAFGVLTVLYGIFRGYTVYRQRSSED